MSDATVPTTTRVRAFVDDNFAAVVVAALVVAAVGGVLTHQGYAQEETRTETRQAASWEAVGEFEHSATVVNGSGPFEEGEVLENRSTYFLRLSPVLDGSFAYTYTASDGGDLAVETRVVLVTRSVEETEEGTVEYWRTERTLATDRRRSTAPDETMRVPFTVNVTAAAARADETEQQVGGTPGTTEVAVVARATVTGTRNGRTVERTRTYRLPVEFEQGVYRVADPGAVREGDTRTETVTVTVPSGPLERGGGPLAFVLGLVGVGGLVLGRLLGDLAVDEREREYLEYVATRREYDDWITTVSDGGTVLGDDRVEVDSLQGLVDLAIDTDARVVEDVAADRLVVTADGVTYVYVPPRPADAEESAEPREDPDGADGRAMTDGAVDDEPTDPDGRGEDRTNPEDPTDTDGTDGTPGDSDPNEGDHTDESDREAEAEDAGDGGEHAGDDRPRDGETSAPAGDDGRDDGSDDGDDGRRGGDE